MVRSDWAILTGMILKLVIPVRYGEFDRKFEIYVKFVSYMVVLHNFEILWVSLRPGPKFYTPGPIRTNPEAQTEA